MRLLLVCLASATALAQEFPKPFNTGTDVGKKPMPASEAVKLIEMPPGFQVTLFASEPEVQNPIACAWDSRGRLWVAENYTYADSKTNFDKTLRDRILIFEDTDHDGKADKRTVFYEGLQNLTSIELGNGGVYATAAPRMVFIADKNGDDKPDGEPETLLDGFDAWSVRHNMVNGLKWGPDGWLYGRHGIQATSKVAVPGTPAAERVTLNCSIWRYHPTNKKFEVVCWGGTNSWGHDWNEEGEGFFINTVIGHLYHIIPGAHYERMYGQDLNPHIYQLLPQTADHYHFDTSKSWTDSRDGKANDLGGGHAHSGCMIYQGDNWPEAYRGKLFTINLHGRRLNVERLEKQGSGYVGKREPDVMFFNDPWFRGVELTCGPDGGVYVLDWSDQGECHENDGVHRESGRIYKITYGTPKPADLGATGDLAKLADDQLVEKGMKGWAWESRQALRLLKERATGSTSQKEKIHARMVQAISQQGKNPTARWMLWTRYFRTDAAGKSVFTSKDQIEGEDLASSLLKEDPTFRRMIASDLTRQADLQEALNWWPKLLSYSADSSDHVLPLLYWAGFERVAGAADRKVAEAALQIAYQGEVPQILEFTTRRITEDLSTRPFLLNELCRLGAATARVGPSFDAKAGSILRGLLAGLRGVPKATKPESWEAFAEKAAQVPALANYVRQLNVIFGDGRALDEIRAVVLDSKAGFLARKQALESLSEANPPDLRKTLDAALKDGDLLPSALTALAKFDDTSTIIVSNYPRVRADSRPGVLAALCSRPVFARALLDAVAAGKIPRADVTPYHARQIAALNDTETTKRLTEVWGNIGSTSEQKKTRIAELKRELSLDTIKSADLAKGRELFTQVCAACHTLYDLGQQGTNLGPNLTGSGRTDVNYLLENIVDPSALVPADYKLSTLTLKDGRVLSGFVAAQTEQTVTLRTMTDTQTIPRADVTKTEGSAQSLMPEGLLDALTVEQRRDLIGFLMKK